MAKNIPLVEYLALEPEPSCFLETSSEVIDFFERELHSLAAVRRLVFGRTLAADFLRP